MNLLNWYETGYSPDLIGAWLCDARGHELVILQRTAVCYSAAVKDTMTGEVLAHLNDRFQTWGQAALWAEAQSQHIIQGKNND